MLRFGSQKTIKNQPTIYQKVNQNNYRFYYALKNDNFQLFAEAPADHLLSHGFTGAHIGLYATSNGKTSSGYADFDRVEYKSVKN